MTTFCDNELCRYHIDVPDTVDDTYQLLEDNFIVTLVRHPIHNPNGTTLNLCSTCTNVIQMLMPKEETETKEEKA